MTEETSLLEYRLRRMLKDGMHVVTQCAWCEKPLATSSIKPERVSHGICADCDRELLQNIKDAENR